MGREGGCSEPPPRGAARRAWEGRERRAGAGHRHSGGAEPGGAPGARAGRREGREGAEGAGEGRGAAAGAGPVPPRECRSREPGLPSRPCFPPPRARRQREGRCYR